MEQTVGVQREPRPRSRSVSDISSATRGRRSGRGGRSATTGNTDGTLIPATAIREREAEVLGGVPGRTATVMLGPECRRDSRSRRRRARS